MYLYEQDRRQVCPRCGSALRRLPRTEADHAARFASAMRRYQCVGDDCTWQGLLPRQRGQMTRSITPLAGATDAVAVAADVDADAADVPAAAVLVADIPAAHVAAPHGWARAGRVLRRAWPMLLAGVAVALALVLAYDSGRRHGAVPAKAPPHQALPPGEHHEGVALSPRHPLARDDGPVDSPEVELLALKQGCAWGKPGTNPYRGSVDQALLTARLPPEVVQRIALKVRAGQIDDRLEISNTGIRTARDGRAFEPRNVAMTYGHTLCVNTRVNFKVGHVERASLYEAADKRGNLYSVMVPDVCGNVSVLGARMERDRKPFALPALVETAHDAPPLLRLIRDDADQAQAVPEPGTLVCALAALAALAALRVRAGRGSTGRRND